MKQICVIQFQKVYPRFAKATPKCSETIESRFAHAVIFWLGNRIWSDFYDFFLYFQVFHSQHILY